MTDVSLPFDEAWNTIQQNLPTREGLGQSITLDGAVGRILAGDVRADLDAPPFSRAMMDGYAIRMRDIAEFEGRLHVTGTLFAGQAEDPEVGHGCAIRIMTGAPVPSGADTVVRFEWCDVVSRNEIRIVRNPSHGESIQPQGDDGRVGNILLRSGHRINSLDIAALRSFGVHHVTVQPQLGVYIIPTGSEVVSNLATGLTHGQVYDVSTPLLSSSLTEDGFHVQCADATPDDEGSITQAIQTGIQQHRVVLLTGGVSRGDADFVSTAITKCARAASGLSVEPSKVHFSRILMRPGTPLTFARIGDTLLFGLSGNPAASFIQFESLVRPALRCMMGEDDRPFLQIARLAHDVSFAPILHTRILRGFASVIDGELRVDTRFTQAPGAMSSFFHANCLVRLDDSVLPQNHCVPIRLLRIPPGSNQDEL